jgi:hypothetical protein
MSAKRNQRGGRHAGSGVETQVALVVEPFTPAPKVADAAVDPSPPAAVDPPAGDPPTTTLAPTEATAKTPTTLEKFVGENIPQYKKDISQYKEETQSDDDKAFKEEKEKRKKEIDDKIKKIIEDADVEYKALSAKYKIAKETYNNARTRENEKELDKISADIDAVYADTSNKLNEIQKELDGDTTPIPVKAAQSLFNFVLNKIQAAFKKSQLNAQALHVSEDTMDILVEKADEMNQNIKEGEEVNMANMEAILNLAKKIADQNAPPPTSSPGPSLLGNAASAAAAALGKGEIPGAPGGPGAAAAAAKALAEGKIPGEEKEPEEKEPEEEEEPDTAAPPDTAPEEEEQGGGGISRKRSHPKYINQISENRNKIFKKELEIINSIRRFHRSHTIRKRDKISSILGFKKSRNNRNRNHGNTKRHHHKHRHNNHKHKSTKHIKK